jgi:hypothetical protein
MIYPYVRLTLLFGCLFIALSVLVPVEGGSMLQITELISHPDHYDRQMVTVIGRATNLQTAANRQGQPGYGFLLNHNGATVKVVALGRAEFEEGDDVIVEGVFNRLRQTGRTVVYNEIKATAIRPISRLNPELVG